MKNRGYRIKQSKSDKLKICLLSYRSNPHCGGQGVYIRHLSRSLKDLGHHVEVISGPPFPQLDSDIQLHRLMNLDLYNPDQLFRTPSLNELKNPINLMEWLSVSTMGFPEPFTFGCRVFNYLHTKTNHFDIIHDNQSLSYGIQALSKRFPLIATIHHPMTVDRQIAVKSAPNFYRKCQQLRWYSFVGMQKRVARSLSHIVTVSKCSAKDISQSFKMNIQHFRIAPNGINTNLFYPIPQIKRIPYRLITTNSADTPLKGLKYLLEAVHTIRQNRPIELYVVGSPKKDGMIEYLVKQMNLSQSVHFLGRITDKAFVEHYAQASIAVVPSLYEGFGLPAGEAMACGIPVISTTGGALPEVIGDAGMLIPPANTKALINAICYFMDHPDDASKIGEAGYQRVHRLFTWKQSAEKTVEVYREAIACFGK